MGRHREKMAISRPQRGAWHMSFPQSPQRTNPADALTLNFQPPDMGDSHFCGSAQFVALCYLGLGI